VISDADFEKVGTPVLQFLYDQHVMTNVQSELRICRKLSEALQTVTSHANQSRISLDTMLRFQADLNGLLEKIRTELLPEPAPEGESSGHHETKAVKDASLDDGLRERIVELERQLASSEALRAQPKEPQLAGDANHVLLLASQQENQEYRQQLADLHRELERFKTQNAEYRAELNRLPFGSELTAVEILEGKLRQVYIFTLPSLSLIDD
jgi:chromosome segregation ATPase